MTETKKLLWRGKTVEDLPLDVLHKLQVTLQHHVSKRANTLHSKRTKKLKIDFKNTENGYLKQLQAAVEAAIKVKQQ